jgi:glycosyltransferase involved in cell wall biosynthesis
MPKRRIALVLPIYWPAVGGCELHTRELALRLAEHHDVRIITLINSEEDKLAHEIWIGAILRAPRENTVTSDGSVSVTRLGMRGLQKFVYAPLARVQSPKVPARILSAAMELLAHHYRRCIESLVHDVDIVHSVHGGVSFLGYAALLAARRLRLPFVYTPLMHLQGKPVGLETNGDATGLSLRLIPRTWTDPYWKKVWKKADALLAMTDYEHQHYVQEGVPAERVFRTGVGPMLPPSATGQAEIPEFDRSDMTVLFLARNTLAKGVARVLGAAPLVWRDLPQVRFVFAGPRAPESDALLQQASDPRIEVLGEVSESQKDSLLRHCTVFCMPSTEESLGATYLEAWSHGKPIIGLRIPPLEELTDRERAGLLAEPTPEDVARKLLTLLRDPALMRKMGEWGRLHVLERYSWNTITARTEAIYESLLENGSRAPRRPIHRVLQ